MVVVAAADVGVHAGEPDLYEVLGVWSVEKSCGFLGTYSAVITPLLPERGPEGCSLFVQSEGLEGVFDTVTECCIVKSIFAEIFRYRLVAKLAQEARGSDLRNAQ